MTAVETAEGPRHAGHQALIHSEGVSAHARRRVSTVQTPMETYTGAAPDSTEPEPGGRESGPTGRQCGHLQCWPRTRGWTSPLHGVHVGWGRCRTNRSPASGSWRGSWEGPAGARTGDHLCQSREVGLSTQKSPRPLEVCENQQGREPHVESLWGSAATAGGR